MADSPFDLRKFNMIYYMPGKKLSFQDSKNDLKLPEGSNTLRLSRFSLLSMQFLPLFLLNPRLHGFRRLTR
jgi:hypothetical protein